MNEYYIIAAYVDNADGNAYPEMGLSVTDFITGLTIAFKDLECFDHVCIFPFEHRNMFYDRKSYTEVLPYVISIDAGDKVNVNKLLTLFKIT